MAKKPARKPRRRVASREDDLLVDAARKADAELERECARMLERGPFTGDSADPDAEDEDESDTDPETGT